MKSDTSRKIKISDYDGISYPVVGGWIFPHKMYGSHISNIARHLLILFEIELYIEQNSIAIMLYGVILGQKPVVIKFEWSRHTLQLTHVLLLPEGMVRP